MVLHKISNPRHMHFFHWRLAHCHLPLARLNSTAAVASQEAAIPPEYLLD